MKIELEIPNTTAAMTVVTVSENLHENPLPMRLCAKSYNKTDSSGHLNARFAIGVMTIRIATMQASSNSAQIAARR